MINKLRDEIGVTIIEVTNNIEQLLATDRIVFIREGSILFIGSPWDFLHQETGFQWTRSAGGLGGLAAQLNRCGLLSHPFDKIESLHESLLQAMLTRLLP